MANDAKFNFYVNRQGPRGQRGEKGDQGFSPSITTNTNTADEYTLLIQNEYDSFVTDNIRPSYDDRGGTYVRVDRANNVQYFGSADVATTANYGEVKLAQASDLASTVDVSNSNVVTVELLKTWFDGPITYLTRAQYDALETKDANTMYVITDEEGGGGTGDVSAAGDNTFTGENTFNGAVNLNGTSIAENLTVKRNLTSNGEINAVSIKTTGLRSDDIQTTANKKYLTEVDVDNQTIQVVDGKISSSTPITYLTRAQYDALETKDANTMYVITDEEGGGGSSITYTAEAPLSISADNVISIDTTDLGGTTLKKDASMNVDYALDLIANGTVGGTSKAARAESNEPKHNAYMAFSGHNPSDAISTLWGPNQRKTGSWVELYLPDGVVPYSAAWTYGSMGEILPAVELLASNNGSSYTSLGSVTGVSTVTASMTFNTTDSYKYLRFKFRDACVTSAWGKFGLTSLKVKSSEITTYTELFIGDNIDVTNGVMNVNMDKIGSELSNLSTRVTTIEDTPILDVPVNNCVLAMPTAPTFDGTNVKVYAGTKVAIPNGLNADGTCKSNIVTLTADATINQSTFNGDVTLMLKSDGTIDQTAYSYFEVDDISTITTLTASCWYYDRKTNNHYLASSTGAKQGPYQRIKIGSYNQATAATTRYFKTYKPIALESDNGGVVSREEFDALVARVAALEASINGSQSA